MTVRTYSSPEAFKQALEQRLRASAKTGSLFARKRQLLVFDRFLARIAVVLGDAATLKGGLVLELRLERARTTKDVDLRMMGSPNDVLTRLQEAARRDLSDFMTFEVGPDADHPEIQGDGIQYEGLRFRALEGRKRCQSGVPLRQPASGTRDTAALSAAPMTGAARCQHRLHTLIARCLGRAHPLRERLGPLPFPAHGGRVARWCWAGEAAGRGRSGDVPRRGCG